MTGEGEIVGGNRDDEHMHYNPTNLWDHHPTNSQNLSAFCDMSMQNNASASSSSQGFWKGNVFVPPKNLDVCWGPTDLVVKGCGVFLPPPNVSQFPADSGFIERAARLSSFSGGSFEVVMNPFGSVHKPSLSVHPIRPRVKPQEGFVGNGLKVSGVGSKETSLHVNCESEPIQGGSSFSANNMLGETEVSGGGDENSNGRLASNRRKSDQEIVKVATSIMSNDHHKHLAKSQYNNNEGQQQGESNPNSVANKSDGKNAKKISPSSNAQKEDYIHVRARRGQATNSHSLAERVRREKISERMEFLQDLVPGCSKVTGKAVMLDEIINYVQSLQRQVEFLSMKLANVNPQMDFNLEGLLTKDMIESRLRPSGSLGSEMAMPYTLNQSQMAIMQGGISGVGRTINSHLMSINGGSKDPASQVPSKLDDDLHNIFQMVLNPNTSING